MLFVNHTQQPKPTEQFAGLEVTGFKVVCILNKSKQAVQEAAETGEVSAEHAVAVSTQKRFHAGHCRNRENSSLQTQICNL